MLNLPHLGTIERGDPRLGETLRDIMNALNQASQTVGIDPTQEFPTPDAPDALSIAAANGFFDAVITDNNPLRGVSYFLEWDTNPSFPAPRTINLGPTRTLYRQLGNLTLYWRCYEQFVGSNQSPYMYFGTQANPTAVVGGGAAGPAPMPSTGTGAGTSKGANPFPPVGGGFGPVQRTPARPSTF